MSPYLFGCLLVGTVAALVILIPLAVRVRRRRTMLNLPFAKDTRDLEQEESDFYLAPRYRGRWSQLDLLGHLHVRLGELAAAETEAVRAYVITTRRQNVEQLIAYLARKYGVAPAPVDTEIRMELDASHPLLTGFDPSPPPPASGQSLRIRNSLKAKLDEWLVDRGA